MQVAIPGNEKDIFKYPEYTAFCLAGFLTLVSKYLSSKSKANISEILSFVERSLFQELSFHIYFVVSDELLESLSILCLYQKY